jgi:hypothetical protein
VRRQVEGEWRLTKEMFVLYKGKCPLDMCDSYRAISLADILSKIYERVLFARLEGWFSADVPLKFANFFWPLLNLNSQHSKCARSMCVNPC